jgi:hypothetical protein
MRTKPLRDFIRENRAELDQAIRRVVPESHINDEERRLWILNDEGLYTWARSAGVRI